MVIGASLKNGKRVVGVFLPVLLRS